MPQHVIQRGVDRQAVFFGTRDYELYRETLRTATNRYECIRQAGHFIDGAFRVSVVICCAGTAAGSIQEIVC